MNVLKDEFRIRCSLLRKGKIQLAEKPGPPSGRNSVQISKTGVGVGLEIVLDDFTRQIPLERRPHLPKPVKLCFDVFLKFRLRGLERRKSSDIDKGCMYKRDVGLEINQRLWIVNGVLIIASVF
jgi:hypothetical protein